MFKFAYYFNMNKSITICYECFCFLLSFCFDFSNLTVPNRRNYPKMSAPIIYVVFGFIMSLYQIEGD